MSNDELRERFRQLFSRPDGGGFRSTRTTAPRPVQRAVLVDTCGHCRGVGYLDANRVYASPNVEGQLRCAVCVGKGWVTVDEPFEVP